MKKEPVKKVSIQFNLEVPADWTHKQIKKFIVNRAHPEELLSLQINNVETTKKGK